MQTLDDEDGFPLKARQLAGCVTRNPVLLSDWGWGGGVSHLTSTRQVYSPVVQRVAWGSCDPPSAFEGCVTVYVLQMTVCFKPIKGGVQQRISEQTMKIIHKLK